MIERRPFHDLSAKDIGWLKAKRNFFSFDGASDRARQGWGALRIWNDDQIAPQAGFPPHVHANMEIITYVREGVVTHRDSLGNEGQTKAGDVQVMSAGTSIITIIDGRYLTSRQEDKWRTRERRITFE